MKLKLVGILSGSCEKLKVKIGKSGERRCSYPIEYGLFWQVIQAFSTNNPRDLSKRSNIQRTVSNRVKNVT